MYSRTDGYFTRNENQIGGNPTPKIETATYSISPSQYYQSFYMEHIAVKFIYFYHEEQICDILFLKNISLYL